MKILPNEPGDIIDFVFRYVMGFDVTGEKFTHRYWYEMRRFCAALCDRN